MHFFQLLKKICYHIFLKMMVLKKLWQHFFFNISKKFIKMIFDYHKLFYFFGFQRSWYTSITMMKDHRGYGHRHYHFQKRFLEIKMVMLATNPSRFKSFFAIYGSSETIRKKGCITILVMILGVRRNFFKEVYQNDYHGVFFEQTRKMGYGNKKNQSYHSSTPRENHWWASYHD